MLSSLRRKRVQRIDIGEWQYYNLKSDVWWKDVGVGYRDTSITIGKQRYSKKKVKQSFDYDPNTTKKLGIVKHHVYSMIFCASGHFWKGSNIKQDNNPLEEMKIEKAFLLGETEITQEIYESVMGVNPSKFQGEKNPVECVSWYDALIFCNRLSDMFKLDRYYTITKGRKIVNIIEEEQENYKVETNENSKGFRLPTEDEWEYAAKAGTDDFLYSGSNDANEVGWYYGNSKINDKATTQPVKQLKPNAWGFYDMSGNVAEWCENKYYPYIARAFRGGAFSREPSGLCSATRTLSMPDTRRDFLGFRVCRYI